LRRVSVGGADATEKSFFRSESRQRAVSAAGSFFFLKRFKSA